MREIGVGIIGWGFMGRTHANALRALPLFYPGVDFVPRLNALIAAGRFTKLIEQCDRRFDQEIREAVSLIMRRARKARLVIVAGPSSSGKTTTTCAALRSERMPT